MRPSFIAFASSIAAAGFALTGARAADPCDPPGQPAGADLARSRVLIAKRDRGGAIAELQRAARADPESADEHNLPGCSCRNAGRLDKAFGGYRIALRLDPKHDGAHEYVGEAHLLARRPERAQEHLAELKLICGGERCEETQGLAKAIADYAR